MSVTSANRLELLQIADAVAREKMIDPSLVIEAMEDSLGKAARSRYGAEYDIRAKIDRKSGELDADPAPPRGRGAGEPVHRADARRGPRDQAGRPARRLPDRPAAAGGLRPHRRAVGEAGDHAEGPRGRAAAPVRGVQGPRRRDHQRHRQAHRVRQRHRRRRPRRGDPAPRPADPARGLPQRRPGARADPRGPPRDPRAADLPLAHRARVPRRALQDGGAGDLRRHHRDQGGGPRPRQPGEDGRHLLRQLDRPGRRLRRHARQPRAGGGRRAPGREDRHHPLEPGPGDLPRQRAAAGRGLEGRLRRRRRAHRGGGARRAALARHRPPRPERAAGEPADRLRHRHHDREPGERAAPGASSPSAPSSSWTA